MLSNLVFPLPKDDPVWQYGGGETFCRPDGLTEFIESMQWQKAHGLDLNDLYWDFDLFDALQYDRSYLVWRSIRDGFAEGRALVARVRHRNDCHREWLDEREESQKMIDAIAKNHLKTMLCLMEA